MFAIFRCPAPFFSKALKIRDFKWVLVPVAVSLLIGSRGLYITMAFAAVTFLVLIYYKKKMGCITGDMLGAMTEITEASLFLAASICL